MTSLRIYRNHLAGFNQLGDVTIGKPVNQRYIGHGGSLRQYRIGAVQNQRLWRDATRYHLMQHPCSGDASLSRVQYKDFIPVGLAKEQVLRARKHTLDAIKVVAC